MLFYTFVAMKLVVGSILLGIGMAKPLETEDYRQYQNNGGNSYTPPILSTGAFGASQSGFSPLGNSGMFMPQSIPPSSLNSYGSSPYGASSYAGTSGGFPAGFSNFFG